MTVATGVHRRLLRRETHRARTAPAVAVAVASALILIVALAAGGWILVDPAARAAAERAAESAAAIGIPLGVGAIVAAVVLIALAVLPGRRARRGRATQRMAVLVDDGVLADLVADRVARRCGIGRSQVSATISRRRCDVRVTPTSGVAIDDGAVRGAASAALEEMGFPSPVRVRFAERGVVS
ncbi:hypothetical protein [Microbacterium karelineae]|uniref:hypothetical protein n=1 Tax=Microbacterium karelineae TaxID=2654283 RepID=UPI0012E9C8A0|nr:hypothetical protein [Microbacterium karelineae]